ncbi:MAG: hypothetical protein RBU27_03125 [Bacteroidota bacterium]|jgi:hypothetical protein|nr:hypothetical protein [Bacteroidota bacterium]
MRNDFLPRLGITLSSLALLLLASACGDTFDPKDLGTTAPPDVYGDTTYVQLQPAWNGFVEPADIHLGFEPFIFVSERGADRVTMLDLAGRAIGSSRAIRRPDAITQDHRLDVLVCAEFDTTIDGRQVTFGAIYRIDLVEAQHNIANATVRRVYFDPLNPHRRYTGISVMANNSYYVTRTGPNNSSPVDPDDAVMLFDAQDGLRPRVEWPGLSVDGTGLATMTQPTGITTFPRPSSDFVFTQQGEKSLFRTQWITQRTTGDVSQWESYYTPARDGNLDFLRVSLFARPEDAAVDDAGSMYVVDAAKDSVFQFNNSGFLTQAFGGPAQFSGPEGIAYFDRTLYVADTRNNRILRFVLSTESQ